MAGYPTGWGGRGGGRGGGGRGGGFDNKQFQLNQDNIVLTADRVKSGYPQMHHRSDVLGIPMAMPKLEPIPDSASTEPVAKEITTQRAHNDGLEGWNPMRDDYNNRTFNAYDCGLGKDLPNRGAAGGGRRDGNDTIQLYVTGIPNEMSEEGVENLFSRAGDVARVHKCRSKKDGSTNTYGFVHFNTVREATEAVRLLDKFPLGVGIPRLKVSFALSPEEKERRAREKQVDEEFQEQLSMNRGRQPAENGYASSSSFNEAGRGEVPPQQQQRAPQYVTEPPQQNNTMPEKPAVGQPIGRGDRRLNLLRELNASKPGNQQHGGLHTPDSGFNTEREDPGGMGDITDLTIEVRCSGQSESERHVSLQCAGQTHNNKPAQTHQRVCTDSFVDEETQIRESGGRVGGNHAGMAQSTSGYRGSRDEVQSSQGGREEVEGPNTFMGRGVYQKGNAGAQMFPTSGRGMSLPRGRGGHNQNGYNPENFHDSDSGESSCSGRGSRSGTRGQQRRSHVTRGGSPKNSYSNQQPGMSNQHGQQFPQQPISGAIRADTSPGSARLPHSQGLGGHFPSAEQTRNRHGSTERVQNNVSDLRTNAGQPGEHPRNAQFSGGRAQDVPVTQRPQQGRGAGGDRPAMRQESPQGYGQGGGGGDHAGKGAHHAQQQQLNQGGGDRPAMRRESPQGYRQGGGGGDHAGIGAHHSQQKQQQQQTRGGGPDSRGNRESVSRNVGPGGDAPGPRPQIQQDKNNYAPSGGQRQQPGVMTNGRQQSGDSDNLSSDGGARRKTESPNAGKNQSPIKARPCVNCGKIGKMQCSKCKAPYCSGYCRKQNWDAHKLDCKPGSYKDQEDLMDRFEISIGDIIVNETAPEEDNVSPVRYTRITLEPGQTAEVVVAHATSPHDVWIIIKEHLQMHGEIGALLTKYHKDSKMDFCPAVGDLCAVKFSEDGEWYRALLETENRDGSFLATFVDYGNDEEVPKSSIKPLRAELGKFPLLAVKCALAGVSPNPPRTELGPAMLEEFKKLAFQQCMAKCLKTVDGLCLVQLDFKGCDLAEDLCERGICARYSTEEHQDQPKPTRIDFVSGWQSLAIGQTCSMEVTVCESPSSFSGLVIAKEKTSDFQKLTEALRNHHSSLPPNHHFRPIIEDAVVAQYDQDKLWYRGVVKDVSFNAEPKKAQVFFVDYGNVEEVALELIHPLDAKFQDLPTLFATCCLQDVRPLNGGQWSTEACDFFKSLLPPNSVKVCGIADDCVMVRATVEDTDIGEILVREGFALKSSSSASAAVDSVRCSSGSERPGPEAQQQQASYRHHSPQTQREPRLSPDHTVEEEPMEHIDKARSNQQQTDTASHTLVPRYSESLRIGHEYLMEVTSPELPNFIGQLGDESTLREFFEELKEALQFFGSDQPPNQSFRPAVGDLVLAQFREDRQWYRGLVKSHTSGAQQQSVQVLFVDYGNVDEVTLDLVHRLESDFLRLPFLGVTCCLSDIQPAGGAQWSADAVHFFSTQVQSLLSVKLVSKAEDCMTVIIRTADDKREDIGQLLVDHGFAERCSSVAQERIILSPHSPTPERAHQGEPALQHPEARVAKRVVIMVSNVPVGIPPKGVKKLMCVTDALSPEDFFVSTVEDSLAEKLEQEKGEVNLLNEPPVVGELVCAPFSFDGGRSWYRAQVLEVLGNGRITVLFVDYGNKEDVPLSDIYPLKPQFAEIPIQGFRCFLKLPSTLGQAWPQAAIKKFQELVMNHPLLVDVERVEGDRAEVNVSAIADDESPPQNVNELMVDLYYEAYPLGIEGASTPEPQPAVADATPTAHQVAPPSSQPQTAPPTSGRGFTVDDLGYFHPDQQELEVFVTHCDDPHHFYCNLVGKEECSTFQDLIQEVTDHCSAVVSGHDFRPQAGSLCCAYFTEPDGKGNWFRGLVLMHTAESGTYEVLCLDLGNREDISLKNLRPFKPSLASIRRRAFVCSLADVEPVGPVWQTAATEKFRELTSDYRPLLAKVVSQDNKTYSLQLWDKRTGKNIAGELVDLSLAMWDSNAQEEEIMMNLPSGETATQQQREATPTSQERDVAAQSQYVRDTTPTAQERGDSEAQPERRVRQVSSERSITPTSCSSRGRSPSPRAGEREGTPTGEAEGSLERDTRSVSPLDRATRQQAVGGSSSSSVGETQTQWAEEKSVLMGIISQQQQQISKQDQQIQLAQEQSARMEEMFNKFMAMQMKAQGSGDGGTPI